MPAHLSKKERVGETRVFAGLSGWDFRDRPEQSARGGERALPDINQVLNNRSSLSHQMSTCCHNIIATRRQKCAALLLLCVCSVKGKRFYAAHLQCAVECELTVFAPHISLSYTCEANKMASLSKCHCFMLTCRFLHHKRLIQFCTPVTQMMSKQYALIYWCWP